MNSMNYVDTPKATDVNIAKVIEQRKNLPKVSVTRLGVFLKVNSGKVYCKTSLIVW